MTKILAAKIEPDPAMGARRTGVKSVATAGNDGTRLCETRPSHGNWRPSPANRTVLLDIQSLGKG